MPQVELIRVPAVTRRIAHFRGAAIGNMQAKMAAIRIDGLCLSLAICDRQQNDSYMTSVHTLFCRYPTEALLTGLPAGLRRLAVAQTPRRPRWKRH